jgi:hypothetical protein
VTSRHDGAAAPVPSRPPEHEDRFDMTTFQTPGPVTATVDLAVGDVRITAEDRADTTVEIRPSDPRNAHDRDAAEGTQVTFADGRLEVRAARLRGWLSLRGGGSVDVVVAIPHGSDVRGTGASADFTCAGRLGECRIKTGLGQVRVGEAGPVDLKSGVGDVTVERATGRAQVTAGSGDVRIGALDAGGAVKNANGDTWVGSSAAELRVNAANGDIAVDRADADVTAKAANGAVRLREAVRGSVVLETRIGDVEVGIREGIAAWVDANATAGKVRNTLEAAEAPGPATETIQVRARTSVGEIVIRRP